MNVSQDPMAQRKVQNFEEKTTPNMTSVILTGYCNHTRTHNRVRTAKRSTACEPCKSRKVMRITRKKIARIDPLVIVLGTEDAEVSARVMTP
jgi:hypothetical protein